MIKQPAKSIVIYFSLVELLVVIAILAILMSILAPSLSHVTYDAKKLLCLNNVKNQASGLLIYAEDNDEFYPRHVSGWRSFNSYQGYGAQLQGGSREIRKLIRPYWGWDGTSMEGGSFPAKTNIEKCPLRKNPDKSSHIMHYFYYFSTNETPRMARIGDAKYIKPGHATTALLGDFFIERLNRVGNHTELNSELFYESNISNERYAWRLLPSVFLLQPISANFAGQDGSATEANLPLAKKGWNSYPGVMMFDWSYWTSLDYIIKY